MASFTVAPIGHVRGGREVPEDDDWGPSEALIALDPKRFTPEALQGLDSFSHAEVVFVFNRVGEEQITYMLAAHEGARTGRRLAPLLSAARIDPIGSA